VFLEDYDIQLARWLVAGCDVWLNNPIAPLEASGTSGIKAAVNGRLNLSVLDGWWAEGFDGLNGWGIPPVTVQDPGRRDALEADMILDTIEEEVVPLYYGRDADACPSEWVRRSKRAMSTAIPQFNMRRVVADYSRGIYAPAAAQGRRLAAEGYSGAKALAQWKARVRAAWPGVTMRALEMPPRSQLRGAPLRLRVAVQLAGLAPQDVRVEFIARRMLPAAPYDAPALTSFDSDVHDGAWRIELQHTGEAGADGSRVYALELASDACGQFQGEVRIQPFHELLAHPRELGLMKWLESD
jgi:starch phosphorylase